MSWSLSNINTVLNIYVGGPCHPWLFIEEAATKEVERDFSSVYSRLVLCKTYRLDEDGKVLTPEEVSVTTTQNLIVLLLWWARCVGQKTK